MKDGQINKLNELYIKGDLVPFIGAGLSYPFKIPTWEDLINELKQQIDSDLHPAIDFYLKRKKYWDAVELIMDFGNYDELEVQENVMKIIQSKSSDPEDLSKHNYSDLGEMDFKLFLTTNYDNYLYEFIKGKKSNPINLSRLRTSSESLLNPNLKTVVHLHGTLSEHDTIVLTKNTYEQQYKYNENYTKLFGLLSGSKTFLFMGFSFDDHYIRNLLKDYKECFNRMHYILLQNPSDDTIKEFKQKYRLEVLPYDTTKGSNHSDEIRRILWNISKSKLEDRLTMLYSLKHDVTDLIIGNVSDVFYDFLTDYIPDKILSDEAFEKADSIHKMVSDKLPGMVKKSVKLGSEVRKEMINLYERTSTLTYHLLCDLMVSLSPIAGEDPVIINEEYFTENYLAEEKIGFIAFDSFLDNEINKLESEYDSAK